MPPVYHLTLFVSSQGTVISLLRLDISAIHWQRKRHMMLFPVLLSNLQRLSTAFEKKKNTQNAVFISILSNLNRAWDVAKRPGDVCSATTEAERRPRKQEKDIHSDILFLFLWERETGLEPATPTLARSCSTNWATRAYSVVSADCHVLWTISIIL